MKKTRLITLFLGAAVLFASCVKEELKPEEPEEPQIEEAFLKASPLTLNFPSEGGSLTVDISCNRKVAVTSEADWFRVIFSSKEEKNEYKLIVSAESYRLGREGQITISAPECEDVTVSVTQSKKLKATCSLKSFSLTKSANPALSKDIEFKFDEKAMTFSAIYLKWIDSPEPQMLIPTFETDGEQVLVGGEAVASGKKAVSFAEDLSITVVAENGDTKEYKVSLNCPQINTELPVLHIKPASLINSKDYYVSTDIILYDKTEGSTGTGWWDSSKDGAVNMRGRGNSTWGLPKKPYRLKFPEKFSPIGLDHEKAKSWVLLSQDMDKSLIRTHIAFAYSRIMFNPAEGRHDASAVLFTPCSRYVNVYMTGDYYDSSKNSTTHKDGEYLGLYQMSDQMERSGGRIAVDKLVSADGSNPDKITGGYIIEADLHEGSHYSGYKGIKMTYKYPDDEDYDPAQYNYISDFITSAEKALYGSGYKDTQNGWRKWFDEKTLVDFIIIKELVGDLDGYTSTYMYKRRGVDKLFFGPIWDCDKGWNNDKRVPHYEYQPLESLMIKAGFWMPPYVSNDWFWRFWSDSSLRKAVNERWKTKRDELLAETYRILDEEPVNMAKAIEANFTVWPFYYQYSGEANMPAATYAAEIERIRDLTERRASLLDRLFAE